MKQCTSAKKHGEYTMEGLKRLWLHPKTLKWSAKGNWTNMPDSLEFTAGCNEKDFLGTGWIWVGFKFLCLENFSFKQCFQKEHLCGDELHYLCSTGPSCFLHHCKVWGYWCLRNIWKIPAKPQDKSIKAKWVWLGTFGVHHWIHFGITSLKTDLTVLISGAHPVQKWLRVRCE